MEKHTTDNSRKDSQKGPCDKVVYNLNSHNAHHREVSDFEFYRRFVKHTVLNPPNPANELRAVTNLIVLLRSDVYHGQNVPLLNGHTAMTIPGAGAGDWSQALLRKFINRIGGDAYPSGINCNVIVGSRILPSLIDRVKRINDSTGQQITLIGHSLGGTLSKLISDEIPEEVKQVISMAGVLNSSIGVSKIIFAGLVPAAALNIAAFGFSSLREEIDIFHKLDRPALVPIVSLYTETDGIITYKSCLRRDAEELAISGASHVDLGMFNKKSFRQVAEIMRRDAPRAKLKNAA